MSAAGVSEARRGIFVGVFTHVRPHLESESVRRNCAGGTTPMNPLTAAISRAAKPALVTAKDFLVQSRGVHCLVQAKELRARCDLIGVRICRVSYRGPGSGDLIRLFQCAPAVPTNHQLAVGGNRVSDEGWGSAQLERRKNKSQNAPEDCFRKYKLRLC